MGESSVRDEQPWGSPRIGDTIVFFDGSKRWVHVVRSTYLHCGAAGRRWDPQSGSFSNRARMSGPCSLATWVDTCRRAVAAGGVYRRDPDYPRDHLAAWGGFESAEAAGLTH